MLAHEPVYLGAEEPQQPASFEEHDGARVAADFTPAPGTLMSIASVTPAAGIPRLTREPTAEVLATALAESAAEPPPPDPEPEDPE